MATQTQCWLKVEPTFTYAGGSQSGWKVVGVSQRQPKAGYAIRLDLNIPYPVTKYVDVEQADVQVMTETDQKVHGIVRELDGEAV